WPPPKVSP
uniref:Bradykinin-potentiating peptide Brachy n=1 Tax=Brachycephalus ephippium TaxID=164302 RepID=BPP_BRAEP|nr:RecName: Full=Bradykinin-potentiating peptide Brachy; Short=BPP-Brachy; Short=BPP-BrachyNH2; AltName: Full=Proline-rich oligopeptide; Short=PRO; Short=Proline-rich peptide [Brachycephalus ephippium]